MNENPTAEQLESAYTAFWKEGEGLHAAGQAGRIAADQSPYLTSDPQYWVIAIKKAQQALQRASKPNFPTRTATIGSWMIYHHMSASLAWGKVPADEFVPFTQTMREQRRHALKMQAGLNDQTFSAVYGAVRATGTDNARYWITRPHVLVVPAKGVVFEGVTGELVVIDTAGNVHPLKPTTTTEAGNRAIELEAFEKITGRYPGAEEIL